MHQVPTQRIKLSAYPDLILDVRREDLIHPQISGNKYRKLKYNLRFAKEQGYHRLLTFGGAYSNHIAATAYAGHLHGFETIGVIRGEELKGMRDKNHTLSLAESMGMKFHFISREQYRAKASPSFIRYLLEEFGNPFILPEGGTNELAVKGCSEILTESDRKYDFIFCSVGTGGTLAGLIRAALPHQKVLGFSSLKGQGLKEDISKFVHSKNWDLNYDYHFGGYAKINNALIAFINDFRAKYDLPLDPVYTGKMMYGICDLIEKGHISQKSKLLAIHTGGLQGIKGMNRRLKYQNRPQINE
jgi:1-aminocyclopropane-1-carboxylate deaminase